MSHRKLFQLNVVKANQAKKMLEADTRFQKAVLDIQNKWHIQRDDPEREENMSQFPEAKTYTLIGHELIYSYRIINKEAPIYEDITKILKQFNLSGESWFDAISHYVLFNKFSPGFLGIQEAETEPSIVEDKDPISGLPTISIKLGQKTTMDDVKNIWSGVEEIRKSYEDEGLVVKKKFAYRKNFSRDSDIVNLYQKGHTISEIWAEIKDKHNQDMDFGNIKKVVSQAKQEFKTKGPKLRTSNFKVGDVLKVYPKLRRSKR